MITLELFGEPQAQVRPRFSRVNNFMRVYDPQSSIKEGCRWQIRSQFREAPFPFPLSVDLIFYLPIPKATSKKLRTQMLNGLVTPMKKPDIDNLQKFILDCLNNLVFKDDAQVVEIKARKIYSTNPGTLIRIRSVSEQIMGLEKESYEDLARKR